MKKTLLFAGIAAIIFLTGCASTTTTIYDPATQQTNLRQRGNVSAEEFRLVADEAIKNALSNQKFIRFWNDFKKENGEDAIPVMKLTKVKNDTDDPDLKIGELTDLLSEALLNSGKVEVTIAEGADLQTAIAASRDLELDPNFNQATVAQRNTLKAARIVLCPKVISSEVKDGRTRAVVRTFVLEMGDIKTGLLMWKYTQQLGFTKKHGVIGY